MDNDFLRDERVEIKPIVRQRSFFSKGHDGEFMFSGTTKGYMLPYSNSTRSYVDIFENKAEQEYFEEELGLKKGSLSVYDRRSDYWTTFTVTLTKEGKTLDLSIPSHMIEYKVLKANKKRISPSWEARNGNAGYEFALVSESQIIDDNYKVAEKNEHAMELFMKIKKSNKKMYDVLRVLKGNVPKQAKDDAKWLKSEIDKIISQKQKAPGILSIDDFINTADDVKLQSKLFVLDAMEIGEVVQKNGGFRLASNDQLLDKNMSQVVDYFESLVGREDKLLVQQRLELNNK